MALTPFASPVVNPQKLALLNRAPYLKRCSRCGDEKPLEDFHVASKAKDGRASYCRPCTSAWHRERKANETPEQREARLSANARWRTENRDRAATRKRERYAADPDSRAKRYAARLRHLFGMTVADYEAVYEAQGRVCAICGQDPADVPEAGKRRPFVDHDHKTGLVRGILCGACNSALGYFRDDPNALRAAIAYLETPPALAVGEWKRTEAKG